MDALNKVTNEKVDVDDVKSMLKGLGIYFPKEELQEVLTSIPLDKDGKVNLEEFIGNLINSGSSPLPETDKDMNEKNGIKDGRSSAGGEGDLSELDIVLQKMGIEASPTDHLELEKLHPINATASQKYIRIDC